MPWSSVAGSRLMISGSPRCGEGFKSMRLNEIPSRQNGALEHARV